MYTYKKLLFATKLCSAIIQEPVEKSHYLSVQGTRAMLTSGSHGITHICPYQVKSKDQGDTFKPSSSEHRSSFKHLEISTKTRGRPSALLYHNSQLWLLTHVWRMLSLTGESWSSAPHTHSSDSLTHCYGSVQPWLLLGGGGWNTEEHLLTNAITGLLF